MAATTQPVPVPMPVDDQFAFPFPIAGLGEDLELAHRLLGPPAWQDVIDGLGDADCWAFAWPCGLQLCITFIHPWGNVPAQGHAFADLPEVQHGMRHLMFPASIMTAASLDVIQPEMDALSQHERWKEALSNLNTFQVWRQGDDGNEIPVGSPTSERDARCWVAELESHGHKQIYWHAPALSRTEQPTAE